MASELDKELSSIRHIVYLCWGTDCKKCGAKALEKHTESFLKDKDLVESVLVVRTKCIEQCEHAPLLCIQPELAWYGPVAAAEVDDILSVHLLRNGKTVDKTKLKIPVAQPQLTKKRKGE
jgi:(2Fe-2S) ferredoxin